MGQWLRAMGHPTQTEQHIPALDYVNADGHHHARLDLVTTIHQNTYYIDVSVAAIHTTDPVRRQQRATTDGAAAKDRVADKRRQYGPHPSLLPFVIETGGRVGLAADALLKAAAPTDHSRGGRPLASPRRPQRDPPKRTR